MILNRGFPIAAQPQPNRTTKAVITADDADMADKTIREICVIRGKRIVGACVHFQE